MSFLSSSYGNQDKPSFFEVMAQDRMIPGLRSATKYLIEVFSQRYFSLGHFYKYHDEYFSFFHLIIENHYLNTYDATFSEYLYGLKRIKNIEGKNKELVPIDRTKSLLYINRLDELFNNYKEDTRRENQTMLKQTFMKIWPYMSACYESSIFIYVLLYLFNKTNFCSPFLHLQNLILTRVDLQDWIAQNLKITKIKQENLQYYSNLGGIYNIIGYIIRIGYTISDYSRFLLLLLVFAFKFLDWYYATEEERASQNPIPIPPYPTQPKSHINSIEVPKDPTLCPLCHKIRIAPSALSVSGYVFCYNCIHDYLTNYQCCPITKIPCQHENIIKIFSQ